MTNKFDYKMLDDNVGIVNQILPHKHKWAWDLYINALNNNWVPSTIEMAEDIKQWNNGEMTEDEKLLTRRCLGFFAGSESLVSNNLLINVYKYITDAECRQYISRQVAEEAIHNHTIVYICDTLNLDIDEVYEAYSSIPAIKAKDDYLIQVTTDLDELKKTDPSDYQMRKAILNNLLIYYLVCEGCLFYSGFAMLLALKQQNKMSGICLQITYTLKDECLTPETELLTPNGWKRIDEITIEDSVAQYTNLGDLEFVSPIKLSTHKVDHIYHFHTQEKHMNMKVSENHRMIYLTKDGNEKIIRASLATYNPYCKHLMAGSKKGGSKLSLTPEEQFLIAFQADGSLPSGEYRNGNICGYIQVHFTFAKDRKKIRLREILSKTGYEYTEKEIKDKPGYTSFHVKIDPNIPYKTFDEWVDLSDVNISWCKEFIEEIKVWDGHDVKASNGNRITYGSVIKSNVDIVQAIAAMCNYRTHFTVRPDDRKETFSDYYRLQICKHRNYITGGKVKKEKIAYEGLVYGIEVPSGKIIVRNEGCVAITGNSLHVKFGTSLINTIIEEYPELWTDEYKATVYSYFDKAVELETAYAKDVLPRGILGLNSSMFMNYIQFIANRRLSAIGLKDKYPSKVNPFPWLSEAMDLDTCGNFFETKVQEYKTGAMEDDF